MNNRHKKKKGMTLIEVIISVTLLSLLLIPVSGLIMNSLKNNKKAEVKQEAAYVGQKMLEEVKAYEGMEIDTASFEFLDGGGFNQENFDIDKLKADLVRKVDGDTNGSKFNVNLTVTKDSNFDYEGANNLLENQDADFTVIFSTTGEGLGRKITAKLKDIATTDIALNSDSIILKINKPMNIGLYYEGQSTGILSGNKVGAVENKILLQLDKDFKEKKITLKIENNLNENVDIYVVKDNSDQQISLISSKGDVTYYQGLLEKETKISDLYKVEVVVKTIGSNEELFKGETTANLKLK